MDVNVATNSAKDASGGGGGGNVSPHPTRRQGLPTFPSGSLLFLLLLLYNISEIKKIKNKK